MFERAKLGFQFSYLNLQYISLSIEQCIKCGQISMKQIYFTTFDHKFATQNNLII
jgi:hypothetical protein